MVILGLQQMSSFVVTASHLLERILRQISLNRLRLSQGEADVPFQRLETLMIFLHIVTEIDYTVRCFSL